MGVEVSDNAVLTRRIAVIKVAIVLFLENCLQIILCIFSYLLIDLVRVYLFRFLLKCTAFRK